MNEIAPHLHRIQPPGPLYLTLRIPPSSSHPNRCQKRIKEGLHSPSRVSSWCPHVSCADSQRPDRTRRYALSATIGTGIGRNQPSPSQSMER